MNANLSGGKQYRTNTQDLEWNEERAAFDKYHTNIGDGQRVLSGLAGMIVLASALSRRNWSGAALTMAGIGLLHRAISGYCLAFGAMGIDMSGNNRPGLANDTNRLGRRKVHTSRATRIQEAIEINRPTNEVYRFWRSLDNLPRIMNHLDSVQVINDRLSHWTVKALPGSPKLEWDAEIINDVENQRIGWRSLQGADVDSTGSVEFKPIADGRQTWLTVTLQYEPPGGKLGTAIAKWFGEDPKIHLADDLQRFKEHMETGVFSHTGDQEASPGPGR
ncbi:MAG: SRPBCC family protein [Nitrospira sp.]|nr:SRPBCC family protein [Nitrospira sp.]